MTMTLSSDPPADVPPVPARRVPIEAAADGAPVASVGRRWLGRFALVAFALYHLPLLLNDYPSLGGGGFEEGLSVTWGHVFGQVGLWIARHVFQLSGPMPDALRGDNGDTPEEYCRLLVGVVIAAIAAVIWVAVDRRRPRARWVEDALHVLLRYSIALGLASYAMAKLYPQQFPPLTPPDLEVRVGELSPMSLLWTFMRYSPVYSTIAGVMEMSVVVLLCFRRTAALGALLCIPVMLNVMLMNLCYNVVVKLYSTMTVVSALVLVLYDARRLIDTLVLRRSVPAQPVRPPFRSRRLNQARWLVKLLLVGGVLLSSAVTMRGAGAAAQANAASPVGGTWDVSSLVVDGRERVGTEASRWRRISMSRGGALLRLEDETVVYCRATPDEARHTLDLACPGTHQEGSLQWTRDGKQLRLDGSFAGKPVTARLALHDDADLPLVRAKFRWTYE